MFFPTAKVYRKFVFSNQVTATLNMYKLWRKQSGKSNSDEVVVSEVL